METVDLVPLIDQLDDNIDDLEVALEPLFKNALPNVAGKLPLLDKAHLFVLVTYAIESILFSYLRLNDVNAKEHPVFRELTRVKQYFEKIKAAESSSITPKMKLDKAAAGRIITHALARNQKHDANSEQQHAEKKKRGSHAVEKSRTREAKDEEATKPTVSASEDMSDSGHSHVTPSAQETSTAEEIPITAGSTSVDRKKSRKRKGPGNGSEAVLIANEQTSNSKREHKKRKKSHKKQNVIHGAQEDTNQV